MNFNVKGLSYDQVRTKIREAVLTSLQEAEKQQEKAVKKSAAAVEQIKNANDYFVNLRSFSGKIITNMQLDMHRYYVYTNTMSTEEMREYVTTGTVQNDKKEEPVTVTTQMLDFTFPIVSVANCDTQDKFVFNSIIEETVKGCCGENAYINYNDVISNRDLLSILRRRYDDLYREANATFLYNHPQKTTAIDCTDFVILESEEFTGTLYGIALDFKSPDGESIKVSIGRYDEKTGEVTIDPISKILTSKGIAKTGQTFRINERVNPTQMEGFLGNILEKVGEFLRGSFKMFLDSFNK